MANRPTTNQVFSGESRRWIEPARWILCLLLLAAIVCLIVFDARTLTVKTHVAAAPIDTAAPFAAKRAVSGTGTGTGHPTTLAVAPPASAQAPVAAPASVSPNAAPIPVLAPAPPASPAAQPPLPIVSAPLLPDLRVIAPREGITGDPIVVRVGIQGNSLERSAQVVLEYDTHTLRALQPESQDEGRVEATLRGTGGGKELGFVAFRFEVIVGEKQPSALTASATTFDAAGKVVRSLPPTQQEVMLRP